jgi:hypothetical protein
MIKKCYLCDVIPVIAGLVIFAEGSYIFSLAGSAVVEGIGGILKSTVQLAALQLLVLGLIVLVSSVFLLFDVSGKVKSILLRKILRVSVIPLGLIITIEAVILAFMGGKTTMDGFGTIEAYIVAGFAAQLFFLGMAIMISAILQKRELGLKKLLVYGGGSAIASAGLVIIGVAAWTLIEGFGWVLGQTIDLVGVQLFLLGMSIVIISLILDRTTKLRIPIPTLRYIAALLVAVEGLILISFATKLNIDGIGWIGSGAIVLSGFGLTLLGLFTLFVTGLGVQKPSPRLGRITMASVLMLTLLLPVAAFTVGQVF